MRQKHHAVSPESERFWEKVNKNGPLPDPVNYPNLDTKCWEWKSSKRVGSIGYGQFREYLGFRKYTMGYAHRWSWKNTNGPIEPGKCVLHRCDNPLCVNPEHLFLGTHSVNRKDCILKGRSAFGVRCGQSKLNDIQVRIMKRLRKLGVSFFKIGEVFRVTHKAAEIAIKGETWKHLA